MMWDRLRNSLFFLRRRMFFVVLWIIVRLVRLIGFRPVYYLMKGLDLIGLGRLIFLPWAAALRRLNRIVALLEWTERKAYRPRQVMQRMMALNMAHDYEAARAFAEREGERVFTIPHFKNYYRDLFIDERRIAIIETEEHPWIGTEESSRVIHHLYTRIWEAHTYQDKDRVERFARLYLKAVNHSPEDVLHVCRKVLFDDGLFELAEEMATQALKVLTEGKEGKRLARLNRLLNEGYLWDLPKQDEIVRCRSQNELIQDLQLVRLKSRVERRLPWTWEDDPELADYLDSPRYRFLKKLLFAEQYIGVEDDRKIKDILDELAADMDKVSWTEEEKKDILVKLHGLKAIVSEHLDDFENARLNYELVTRNFPNDQWFNEMAWRHVMMLLHERRINEAVDIVYQRLEGFWSYFGPVETTPIRKRLRKRQLIPRKAAVLGGWGLGDVLISTTILKDLRRSGGHYYVGGDPRLGEILEPGNEDWLTFVPTTRVTGPHAVSEKEYWLDRDGIQRKVDMQRANRRILELGRKAGEIILAEDVIAAGLSRWKDYRPRPESLIKITQAEVEAMRELLRPLPGKVRVGLCWRSGEITPQRALCYTTIEEWAEAFELDDVIFVNLQYSDTRAEVQWVHDNFGNKIFTPPDIDLKNDLRKICALAKACDVVISPGTALREMSGAAGARTWSLSVTPKLPEMWRVREDGRSDILYPNMEHFTVLEYGSKRNVVRAMVERIEEMARERA